MFGLFYHDKTNHVNLTEPLTKAFNKQDTRMSDQADLKS